MRMGLCSRYRTHFMKGVFVMRYLNSTMTFLEKNIEPIVPTVLIIGVICTALACWPVLSYALPMPIGGEFQVNTTTAGNQDSPTVARDAAGNFVVVWEEQNGLDGDFRGIFAQRYNAAGVPQGPEFQVNTTTAGNQIFRGVGGTIGMDANGNFVIVWEGPNSLGGDGFDLFAQRYGPIPEPSSFALLAIGLLSLGVIRRRRG